MSARRSSRPTVSLFEFLAVLVCAMGALILLLLVTTRKIRQQALAAAKVEVASTAAVVEEPIVEVPVTPPIVLATPSGDAPVWSPAVSVWEPEPSPPEPDPHLEAQLANDALRREWESNVDSLETQQAALQQNWDEWQVTLTAAEAAIRSLQSRLSQLDDEHKDIGAREAALQAHDRQLHQSYALLQQEIDATATQLEVARSSPTPVASRFSILPYDSATGTTRRPIIIECTESEIRFASEGIVLNAADIQGFTPAFNPLQAGADALVDYWQDNDPEAGRNGDPYIMLVVRPGGTISFYIARKLLESVGDRFGYELVGEDQEFVWPETTPEATRLCREAVESRIAERNRVIDHIGGGNLPVAGPLQFMDDRGNFFLEEVAQLRDGDGASTSSNGGGPTTGGTGRDRGDLSAIFGGPVDDSVSREGSPTPHTPSSDRPPASQSLYGSRAEQSTGRGAAADSESSTNEQSGQTTADGTSREQPRSGEEGADETGGPGSDAESQQRGMRNPANSRPSWIEQPRGPDSSPSFQTHPGLFGRGQGGSPSADAGPSSSSGRARPLVVETGSHANGVGDGGDAAAPAPVIRGLNEPASDRGTVGYQRDLYVYIDGSSFQVAGEDAVAINADMTREQVSSLLAESLRARIATWEAPPENGAWVPRVRFEIRRGGNAHLRQMTEIVSEWQINWTANYTSE